MRVLRPVLLAAAVAAPIAGVHGDGHGLPAFLYRCVSDPNDPSSPHIPGNCRDAADDCCEAHGKGSCTNGSTMVLTDLQCWSTPLEEQKEAFKYKCLEARPDSSKVTVSAEEIPQWTKDAKGVLQISGKLIASETEQPDLCRDFQQDCCEGKGNGFCSDGGKLMSDGRMVAVWTDEICWAWWHALPGIVIGLVILCSIIACCVQHNRRKQKAEAAARMAQQQGQPVQMMGMPLGGQGAQTTAGGFVMPMATGGGPSVVMGQPANSGVISQPGGAPPAFAVSASYGMAAPDPAANPYGAAAADPATAPALGAQTRVCTSCGRAEESEFMRFCTGCGAALPPKGGGEEKPFTEVS